MKNKTLVWFMLLAIFLGATLSIVYAENYTFKLRPDIISYLQFKAGSYKTFEFGWYQKDFNDTAVLHPTVGKNTFSLMIFNHTRVIMRDLGGWTISIESDSPMYLNYQIKNQPSKFVSIQKILFKYNLKRNQIEVVL